MTTTSTAPITQLSGNAHIEDATERLHDKLRKLLVMSKQAATEAEAITAASLLQRFLTEHNLDVAQLESKGAAAPGVHELPVDLGKAAFKWKLDLAEYVAEHFYCAAIVDRKSKTVAFVGRPDNVQSLQMLYGWIIDQIKRIAADSRKVWAAENPDSHMDPLRWQVNFGEGAAARLAIRLQGLKDRQARDMARNAAGDIVGLVLHHQKEVSDYLEEKFGYRTDGRKTKAEEQSEARWADYERRQAEAAAYREELRAQCEAAGDMEPFYHKFPYERPKTAAQIEAERKAAEKADREYERRERRNAARRTGRMERYNPETARKDNQAWTARIAGRQAADKVNLQPFIGGEVDKSGGRKVKGAKGGGR
jgi:hypothetical protein